MGQVAEAWLECQKRIDDYVDEEVAMKTKQRFLKEDWEVFKQRHFIEQLNSKKEISGDSNFTDTMRHLLSSQLSISDCPNCNYRRRCTCDDCSLSHILMCGIMDSPVTDDVHSNHLPLQTDSASDCQSEIHLPNMSSASSESSSSSPFTVLQINGPRILADNTAGLTFNTENEDVAVISEKLDLYSIDHYDNAAIEDVNGIHRELNGGVDNATLKFESLQDSSTSSSSSEADAEEPSEENSSSPDRIQEDDVILRRNMIRNKETKRDNPMASYSTQEADQGPACCECHICKQEIPGPSSDTEMRCHQFKIPEKLVHPGLHLYPHIHGKIPLHSIPHLPPTLIHPSFYTASPFTQNKALVQNQTINQQILSTSFQDHIYSGGLGSTTDWKSSKFLSIWESEVMNEKDWNASNILQDALPGNDMVTSTVSELGPSIVPVASRKEGIIGADSKKKDNILKKKCLYHFQDAFMDTSNVVMATSSATSSVSCTATTVQSSNNQFKVSSKRSSSLGDVFHSITTEDHRCSASAVPQSSPNSLAPLSSLSPMVLSPTSASNLPSPNAPSFSRVITTAPSFVDPHAGFYATTAASPSAKENLSSAPSSVCSDPDCEGQHCENSLYDHPQYDGEDSQDDDSCSEHSSSTSASTNQKEGKYCDCCYCEFFGHGGPPAAPTSRNYTEMREKLRLRLTKRKEGQPRKPELNSDKEMVIDHRKVEDLLQFINSPETKPVNSTRTAKRARHKQKKLKEKSHPETEQRESQQLEQQCQEDEEPQPQDLKAAKKKKKERTSTNCQKMKGLTRKCPGKAKPSPGTLESMQTGRSEKIETSSDTLAQNASIIEQGAAPENLGEASEPVNGEDSELLFKTEMSVKSHEPLSLLLNIMHQHREDKNKQQITQISKLFAQQLKKPSKATDHQPKIKNKMQSKLKATELPLLSTSKKEEKKASSNKTKQMNSVAKSSLGRSIVLPREQLHTKLLSQDSPQPKSKSKKNKKKKSDKGNSSIDDVFLPKDVDLDNVEMDETEREVEYFKRFCLDSARQTKQRLSINWSNFSLKKATFAAH